MGMIEARHLSAGYENRPVLQDISLAIPQGKLTVLLGPNGCGKTTLFKTLLGLLKPQAGEVLLAGRNIASMTPGELAKQAAYMAQTRNTPSISARRMVLHGRFPYLSYPRRYREEDHQIVREALRQADALDLIDRPMQELSGGQRQKVYLAMALAQQTPVIFMDEPTAFLDVRHQLELMDTARMLADSGKTVVLVLHDLSLALRAADLAAVMQDGRLMQAGTPEEVYASGVLQDVFGVAVRRIQTDSGWQYYCERA